MPCVGCNNLVNMGRQMWNYVSTFTAGLSQWRCHTETNWGLKLKTWTNGRETRLLILASQNSRFRVVGDIMARRQCQSMRAAASRHCASERTCHGHWPSSPLWTAAIESCVNETKGQRYLANWTICRGHVCVNQDWVITRQHSCRKLKTARCAQYMGALKSFESRHYAPGYCSRNS